MHSNAPESGSDARRQRERDIKCVSIRHKVKRELMFFSHSFSASCISHPGVRTWFSSPSLEGVQTLSSQSCTLARSQAHMLALARGHTVLPPGSFMGDSLIFSQLYRRSTVGIVFATHGVTWCIITPSQTRPRSIAEGDCFYCFSQLVGRALALMLPGTQSFLCYSRRCRRP